jgi:CRP-like cAMP-binding protein
MAQLRLTQRTSEVNVPDANAAEVRSAIPVRGWFADCSPGLRHKILALARPKSYAAGSVVFRAGDVGADAFGIISGVVTVERRFAHPDATLMHMLWPGEWFGPLEVIIERYRHATMTARTDAELLRIPGDELQALLRRHPEDFVKLTNNVAHYLDVAMQCAAELLIRDASARCAAVLLRLTGRRWASGPELTLPIEIPAPQSELAMLCNLSRSSFSRVIREFARHGIVTVNYRSLTVNDPARLLAVAENG